MQDNQPPTQFYGPNQTTPYASTELSPDINEENNEENSISWTASEFIYHEKSTTWFMGLGCATFTLALSGFFILGRDWYTLIIIMLLGIIFGVAAARKPRILQYIVDDYGLSVDQKHYTYDDFKFFSIIDDKAISSMVFIPSNRLGTSITIYVPADKIDDVSNLVSTYLPLEKHDYGYADKFLNKIKF